jgi:release factor glutamine methyltransferase
VTTIRETWVSGAERLTAAGIEEARLDARVLLAHTMNLAPGETVSSREPSAAELARYEELLERRIAREPTAYIIGEREFWSLSFAVGPGVLIPRPESETLIEQAIKVYPDRSALLDVLDLGTGSGCLILSFLSEYLNARGLGVDRSPDALYWARRNAARHGLESRCAMSQSDWAAGIDGRYDLVFCNPPYLSSAEMRDIAPELSRFEPQAALEGGTDGLAAYRSLGPLVAKALKPDGRAFFEIGSNQGQSAVTVLKQEGLSILAVVNDLAGHPRCIVAATGPA